MLTSAKLRAPWFFSSFKPSPNTPQNIPQKSPPRLGTMPLNMSEHA